MRVRPAEAPPAPVPNHPAAKSGGSCLAHSIEPGLMPSPTGKSAKKRKLIEEAVRDGFLSGLLGSYTKLAEDIVRERWIKRGIWNGGPGSRAGELWKHEEADAGLYQTA